MPSIDKNQFDELSNIMIVGSAGSGKSTLAYDLSQITGMRLIHMDHAYWQSGWVMREQEEINALILKEMQQEGWICEGNNSQSFFIRVPHARILIWLDLPRYLCMWRVLKRTIQFYRKSRPDLPDGCYDRFDWAFFKWVWNFNKTSRPRLEKNFNDPHDHLEKIYLKSPADVSEFMKTIGQKFDAR